MLFGGLFSELVDQRVAKGRRYALEPLLCGLLLAVLSGATSLRKMELFLNERLNQLNSLFGTHWKKAPTWVGIRRFMLKLDVQGLEEALRQHAGKHSSSGVALQFVAIDGKALRASASRVTDTRARQLVSAFAQLDLIVLGHVEVPAKTNEIPATQALIEELALSGRVFTLDAMHCQKKTLSLALAHGADVLVQVKDNQPELFAVCQMIPKFQAPAQQHTDHDKGHGRIEIRTIQTFVPTTKCLPQDWQPLVKAVIKVTREVTHKRKGVAEVSTETAWWVSTALFDAEQFQAAIRGHWSIENQNHHIENQNHHVRDVALFEDACRIRQQPGISARLRSIALNCMRLSKVSSISRTLYRNALNFDYAVSIAEGRS